jgi:hypothetical protein
MKRTDLNGLVDALAAVEALLLLSTGLLIWLRLPAGSGHGVAVWSLDRHQWGDIHAWIAMTMVATLVVHLALHWKWIVCVVSGQDAATKRRRQLVGLVTLGAILFTVALPLIAPLASGSQAGPAHGYLDGNRPRGNPCPAERPHDGRRGGDGPRRKSHRFAGSDGTARWGS